MKKSPRGFLGYLVLIAAFVVIAVVLNGGLKPAENKRIEYNDLLGMIEKGEVDCVAVRLSNLSLVGLTKNTRIARSDFPDRAYDFETTIGLDFTDTVIRMRAKELDKPADMLSENDLAFTIEYRAPIITPWYIDFLPFLFAIGGIALIFFFFMRQQSGGSNRVFSFGKSRARMSDPSKNKTTFKDVAGADEEKQELQEMVDFLRNPRAYTEMGARIPKGVLLVGPPGTGKTLLAKAVAGEADAPFFTISGSDFVEMFVGVGASRVRDLFEQAKKAAPSIVFIDEIDAVGRHRGAGLGGGHDEREQTLNQLLVEMDGFSVNEGVIVMAATNRRDILDPALLRPGRFDRQVTVNFPDHNGRVEILKVHSRGKPLGEDVDLANIAKRMPYATGADLENVMNEAAILAARTRAKAISQQLLVDAIARVQMGPEKRSHKVTEQDRKLVAVHESGHAIIGHFLPGCDEVHLVTIVPRGQAAGHTLSLPAEERDALSRKGLMARVSMYLGGYAAENLTLDDVYTGSSSDLKYATELCRRMVTQLGMSEELGTIYLGSDQEVFIGMDYGRSREYSEDVAARIDREVSSLLNRCYEETRRIISQHREQLDWLTEALLEHETLSRREFVSLMETGSIGQPDPDELKPRVKAEILASMPEPEPEPEPIQEDFFLPDDDIVFDDPE
ncbi:MAG: ATP-dependent zinc metalloprotease FtsH [Clostridia bacterium]|nr:ATP-dependent zinc metalloprotease FtsH [Clostridia bacterium]